MLDAERGFMTIRHPTWFALAATLLAGCGPEPPSIFCGDGTHQEGDVCVPDFVPEPPSEDAGPPPDLRAPVTTAEPPGGIYTAGLSVTLRSDEPAEIFYTTDDSDPTRASPSGTSPVVLTDVADGTVLRFFAVDEARNTEPVRTEVYVVDGQVPSTTISPPPGDYQTLTVLVLGADEPATIYYTTDGTDPTTSSESGASPIVLPGLSEGTTELRYFAVDAAGNAEAVQSASYRVDKTPPATIAAPPGGRYVSLTEVTLTSSEGATIYYTTDGSPPTLASSSGASPVTVTGIFDGTLLRFFALDASGNAEPLRLEIYGIDPDPPVVTPTPPGGSYPLAPLVLLTTDEPATVYYTTDGSDPTTSSPSGIDTAIVNEIRDGTVLKYFAVDDLGNAGAIEQQFYTVDPDVPTTTADPPPGLYQSVGTVTLTSDKPATIYYTTDGSNPTQSSTSGASPVTVTGVVADTTLKFFAIDSLGNIEAIKLARYVIDGTAPTSSAIPAGGSYQVVPLVVLSANEPANIRYTLDGSDPNGAGATEAPSPVFVTGIQDGDRLRFIAIDGAGNVEGTIREETYSIDSEPPVTAADPPGGAYASLPSITLTSSESATIYATTDGSVPSVNTTPGVASPATISTLPGGGVLRYFAVDAVGNIENVKTHSYVVDGDAPSITASPPGGVMRAVPSVVTLFSDEPATIYFTTDGSPPTTSSTARPNVAVIPITPGTRLRYFAVDEVGNSSTPDEQEYILDLDAPGVVEGLSEAGAGGGTIDVSWTNPTAPDLGSVILVRRVGQPPTFVPAPGESYQLNDTVGPGETVVYAGLAETHNDTPPARGFTYYAAFAGDGVGNWSVGRIVMHQGDLSLGNLSGSISVGLDGTVTVPSSPDDFDITVDAVTYDDATDTLVITVTLQSGAPRVMHTPKLVIDAVNEGAVDLAFAGSVQLDGDPTLLLGAESLEVGASVTRQLGFTGITGGTDPIVIDLTVRSDPLLVVPGAAGNSIDVIDSSGAGQSGTIATDATTRANGPGGQRNTFYRSGVVSADGRRLYLGHANLPRVTTVDLSALTPTLGAFLEIDSLDEPWGRVTELALNSDGTALYVLLGEGVHKRPSSSLGGNIAARLVMLDAHSLVELDRMEIFAPRNYVDGMARGFAISPDGSTAAVSVLDRHSGGQPGSVYLIDLDSLTLIDTDGGQGGVQPLTTPNDYQRLRSVAFNGDGSELFVLATRKRELIRFTIPGYARTTLPASNGNGGSSSRGGVLVGGPDGRIYEARRSSGGLNIWDGSWTRLTADGPNIAGLVFHPAGDGRYFVFDDNNNKIHVRDLNNGDARVRTFDASITRQAEIMAVTPF
jgi:hypothetical protein